MKFTKEQAVESLKRELTNNGKKTLRMSERTLDSIVETLLPKFANEDTGLPDFITEALVILNPVNDNIGKDKSDFAKQWAKDHPTEPEPTPDPKPKPAEPNSEYEALKREIEAMKAEREQEALQRKLSDKRNELLSACKEKGIKDDEWLNSFISEVNITEELNVSEKADSWLKLYNKSKAHVEPAPTPLPPNGGKIDSIDSLKRAAEMAKKQRESQKF